MTPNDTIAAAPFKVALLVYGALDGSGTSAIYPTAAMAMRTATHRFRGRVASVLRRP